MSVFPTYPDQSRQRKALDMAIQCRPIDGASLADLYKTIERLLKAIDDPVKYPPVTLVQASDGATVFP